MSFLKFFPIFMPQQTPITQMESVSDKCSDYSVEFPFLCDEKTIQFIKKSKIIFINRGLPGSGKSTLSERIASLYESTVICSADEYFTDENGKYNFDINKRPAAHEACQKKAEKSCSESASPIIIDNTNILYWEIKHYLNLATKYDYIVLVIEPRTPHKFDIEKLALTNKHSVPLSALKAKLKEYRIILPYYFAWFLNSRDSTDLINLAKNVLKETLNLVAQFKNDLSNKKMDVNDFLKFHDGSLHCTTKFIGRTKQSTSHEDGLNYVKNELIALNIGKCFSIKIAGFSMTDKSLAAIVNIENHLLQKILWNNNLEDSDVNSIFEDSLLNGCSKETLLMQLEHGSHAHITLAVGPDVKHKQSGVDLLKIKLIQLKSNSILFKHESEDKEYFYFGSCCCLVKFKTPLVFDTIFTGRY